MTEIQKGDIVKITQGRHTNKTGTYVRALPCGQFHIIDLGKGLRILAPRSGFEIQSMESKQNVSVH